MVRFSSSQRYKRGTAASRENARRILRRLLDENVTLLRQLEELRILRRLSHQDGLTGLPNRRIFDERLAEELARPRPRRQAKSLDRSPDKSSSRSPAMPVARGSLLVIDINDLKRVNDQHGHAAGDVVVRAVAETLRTALRPTDLCCRTGGDEFMVLMPDTDASTARQVMSRVRAEMIRTGSRSAVPVSVSIGRTTWPDDGRQASRLVEKADRAMYAEKRRSQDRARRRKLAMSAAVAARGRKLALVK